MYNADEEECLAIFTIPTCGENEYVNYFWYGFCPCIRYVKNVLRCSSYFMKEVHKNMNTEACNNFDIRREGAFF